MLGVLRVVLALMVMTKHLFWHVGPLGSYPVFGFYLISGYLMTLTLHQSYGYTARGRWRFAFNRFLRLYPMYWAVALLSAVLVVLMARGDARAYHYALYLPRTAWEVVSNIFMLYPAWIPWHTVPRLSPPTWALTVEIFFYVLMGLGLSRTAGRTLLWFVASIAYVLATFCMGWDDDQRYFPVAAASLPFSMGALLYFVSRKDAVGWKRVLMRQACRVDPGVVFLLFLGNCVGWSLAYRTAGAYAEIGQYLNLLLCGWLLLGLVAGGRMFPIRAQLDKRLGDYSYPVYLLHWQVGMFLVWLLHGEPVRGDSWLEAGIFLLSLPVVAAVSWCLLRFVEQPLQRMRQQVRGGERGLSRGA